MTSTRKRFLPFLPVALLIACAYANSLTGELFYDNRAAILEDPRIRDASHVAQILSEPYWYAKKNTLYRPLTTLSYMVNYSVLGAGEAPFSYHLVNLLLHGAVAALVFAIARRMLRHPLSAVLAAVLFGVHPVTTEAVTNVVGRADLLATMFVLLGLLAHLRWRDAPRERLLAQLPFALALLSKESGSVLPAIVLAADFMLVRRDDMRAWLRREVPILAPYAITFGAYASVRFLVGSGHEQEELAYLDNPLVIAHGLERLATVVKVFGLQLVRWLAPWTLSGDYSFDQIALVATPLDPLFLTGFVGFLSVLALGLVSLRTLPLVSFGVAFWLLALLPVCNLFVLIGTIMGERLLYMPLVGIAILFAALADAWLARSQSAQPRRLLMIGFAALATFGVLRTFARNGDWATEYDFWKATFATSPRSVRARTMFAEKHADRLMHSVPAALDDSLRVLEEGLSITPREPMLLASLSWYSLIKVGRLAAARRFAEADALLGRVRRWVETALAVDADRTSERARGLSEARAASSGHLETYRAHGALVAQECLLAEAMGRPVDTARLAQAEMSLRRAVLASPSRVEVVVELMQNLLAQQRPADAVIAGLWPLLMSGDSRSVEPILRQAYQLAGIDAKSALTAESGRLLPRVTNAPSRAIDLLMRSERVLVRMALALGSEEQARREISKAERRGLARATLESVLGEHLSITEARFWESMGR